MKQRKELPFSRKKRLLKLLQGINPVIGINSFASHEFLLLPESSLRENKMLQGKILSQVLKGSCHELQRVHEANFIVNVFLLSLLVQVASDDDVLGKKMYFSSF